MEESKVETELFYTTPEGIVLCGLDAEFDPVPLDQAVVVKAVYPDGRVEFIRAKND